MSTPNNTPIPSNPPGPWPVDYKPRSWQSAAFKTLRAHQGSSFLLEACPGGGKTFPGLRCAWEHLSECRADQVIVLVPTTNLARQWARAAAQVGIQLQPNWSGVGLPRDTHGIAITYQRLAAMPELYRHACAQKRTLVIADEPHHMGESAAWGRAFVLAFEHAAFRLLLSGTPFRSDSDPIPGVTYGPEGEAKPDFVYSYREAIRGRICRKIAFVKFDGELRWASDGAVVEASFGDRLDQRQSRLRHRTAISTHLSDGLVRMIRDADERLTWVREHGHPDAGGLIIACDIQHAQDVARLMERELGEPVTVAHSDDPEGSLRIERFRDARDRWLVAINMVSEGVDIPRLRVGVYATTTKTALFFRQVIGRFVRTIRGMQADPSFLFIPADPALQLLAREIEQEMRHQLSEDDEPALKESDGGDGANSTTFVPLDARVEAAETVMSGMRFADPDQAAAVDALSRRLGIPPEQVLARLEVDNEPVLPPLPAETEFERRERLRRERKRLVGILHHRSGRDYQEIQQWVNEVVAAGRPVTEHTIPELEHAARLLTGAVTGSGDVPGVQAA